MFKSIWENTSAIAMALMSAVGISFSASGSVEFERNGRVTKKEKSIKFNFRYVVALLLLLCILAYIIHF